MDYVAHLFDRLLKHAVRGRIRDHERRELVLVLLGFSPQILHVNVTLVIAANRHDRHAKHLGRGWIRPVGRGWNDAHVAVMIAARLVIFLDRKQASVLALGTRVRLQRYFRKASDVGEILFEISKEFVVTLDLISWREWMKLTNFWPSDGHHFCSRVQLHGARAERDHRMHQRDIARLQTHQVPQHFMLRVVRVEHWVRHIARLAFVSRTNEWARRRLHFFDQCVKAGCRSSFHLGKDVNQRLHAVLGVGFVKRNCHFIGAQSANVDTGSSTCIRKTAGLQKLHGIKYHSAGRRLVAKFCRSGLEKPREAMRALGNGFQTAWSMVYAVHGGHVCE
mmetsp:Transcript_10487/g.27884  ORF Transcript_10487/g.27884 Transcript_10487/m.27884 type:complete len:335 (+) Transcript_10487:983-1987(+)